MSIIRGIEAVDSVSLNLISTGKELKEAVKYGDVLGATHAALEHTSGYATGANYVATAVNKGAMLAAELAIKLPFHVDPGILNLLEGITVLQAIGGLGTAISAIAIATNSILIYRDNKLLTEIPATEELKNTDILKKTLEKLENVNYNHFKKTLPEYLRLKIEQYRAENIFTYLKDEIADGRDVTARNIVSEIKDHVNRSRVVHILALIGSLVALTAAIGLLVAFPPLLVTALTVIGIMITITCVVMKKGWVENPKDGFNWRLVLPEFLQKKLKVDPTIELEMEEREATELERKELEEITNAHEGIVPLPHFITESEISQEDVATFLKPIEPEKEPTFWEKLKAKFARKKETIEEPKVETPIPVVKEEKSDYVAAAPQKEFQVHPLEDRMPASTLDHMMAEQGMLRMGSHGLQKLSDATPAGSR